LAKRIIGDGKAIKLALSLEHDAKKLERVLAGGKAHLPSQVYALLSPQPQPVVLYLLANAKTAKVQNSIKNFLFKFPEILSHLPRTELQSLGVKPGPEFDRILSKIFAMQLDGKIKSHQQLMKEMRDLAGIKEPPPPPPVHPPKKGKEIESPAAHPRRKGRESAPVAPPSPPASGKATTKAATAPALPAPPAKSAAKAGAKHGEVVAAPTWKGRRAPKPQKKRKKR
jgi:hypothetical protein